MIWKYGSSCDESCFTLNACKIFPGIWPIVDTWDNFFTFLIEKRWTGDSLRCFAYFIRLSMDSATAAWIATRSRPAPDDALFSKEYVWDAPVIAADTSTISSKLAVNQSRGGSWSWRLPQWDWPHTFLVACRARIDEAIRVAVGVRLSVNLYEPHYVLVECLWTSEVHIVVVQAQSWQVPILIQRFIAVYFQGSFNQNEEADF